MLTCGITYNDYNIEIGRLYVYLTSPVRGVKIQKFKVLPYWTEEFHAEKKDIAENTSYNDLERYKRMYRLIDFCAEC